MKISTALISFSLTATAVVAAPHRLKARAPSGEVVVYWGQNAAAASENNDLSTYCAASSGIDIIVLTFLYEYGNSIMIPSGVIGQDCSIRTSGEGTNCDSLASQISTCQSNGVKVILSLGGAVGSYSLTSQAEAETIGQNLWDAYGNTSGGSVPRPFGSVFVNGWDFDIEAKSEPNMGEIITAGQFDYLWIQFYNNGYCSYPNTLNYADWVSYIAGTRSANAKVFLGVPASELGSTGTQSGAVYYQPPSVLASTVASFDTSPNWGGIMMWDAAFSDANVVNGCNYAQQAASILKTGSPCGGGGITTSPTPTTSAIAATSSGTATGTPVAQWGQCGGERYTGSTVCASPYKCVEESIYWSSCQ
ncbi:hypothetical protein ZTR_09339 [Talaromyces verruculosus]|nr:hypothetical protein ZTR_09339 [Talaromyces verruculosus]